MRRAAAALVVAVALAGCGRVDAPAEPPQSPAAVPAATASASDTTTQPAADLGDVTALLDQADDALAAAEADGESGDTATSTPDNP